MQIAIEALSPGCSQRRKEEGLEQRARRREEGDMRGACGQVLRCLVPCDKELRFAQWKLARILAGVGVMIEQPYDPALYTAPGHTPKGLFVLPQTYLHIHGLC